MCSKLSPKNVIPIYTLTNNVYATGAAKLLQLCPTLWDLIDGSLPGSSFPGILQVRTLEWLWEDLEGAGREGGGRGDRDGEDM